MRRPLSGCMLWPGPLRVESASRGVIALNSLHKFCKYISRIDFPVFLCAIKNLSSYSKNRFDHAFRAEFLLGRTIVSSMVNVRSHFANQQQQKVSPRHWSQRWNIHGRR
jgi:hypothetical protein